MNALDPIALGIMWDRLVSITDQILLSLVRTSFSSIVRESYDLSVVMFDRSCRTLAQANYSMPSFTGTAPETLKHMLRRFPAETLGPGDVVVTNDPWMGTGHVYDLNVMRPVFRDGTLAGFTMTITHLPDIGGRGYSAVSREIFDEGIVIPVRKLLTAGRLDDDLLELIRANVRVPDQVMGDIMANVAANEVGARMLDEFMDDYGLTDLDPVGDHIISRSEESMRRAIAAIPDGVYRNSLAFEGFDGPLKMAVMIKVDGELIDIDFAGTSESVPAGINVPFCYTRALTFYTIKCLTTPDIPNNEGSFGPIRVIAPPGCILNAQRPSATGARHITAHFINPLVFGALSSILPTQIQADSGMADVLNFQGRHPDGTFVSTMFFSAGGYGALQGLDGHPATPSPANMMGTPVEVWEMLTGMKIERREILADSGGVGQYRGGVGQRIVLRNDTGQQMQVSCLGMRSQFPAIGFQGGGPGRLRTYRINGAEVHPEGRHILEPGDVLEVEEAGGGGFGDPRRRDRDSVARDVTEGFVSRHSAVSDYGADALLFPDRSKVP
jgi:N-methylhydantoinase B